MTTAVKSTRKKKTAEDLKAQLAAMKASLAALEQRAYAGELEELVKNSAMVKEFQAIRSKVQGASDVAILAALGRAVGIKRVEVTQKPAAKRAARKTVAAKTTAAKARAKA
jgi:ribosomal protein L29